MKYAVVLSCLIVSAMAALADEKSATILNNENNINPDGTFENSYKTSNGISAHNVGNLKEVAPGEVALTIQGESSYTAPGGEVFDLGYIADENGYQAFGSHLPTSPPIPDAIVRLLKYLSSQQ